MKRSPGMSLMEVLVVVPLLLVVFGMVLSFLLPGLRAWARSDGHSQAQQNALVVVSRVTREVEISLPQSLFVQSVVGRAADGTAVHQDAVMFVTNAGPDGQPSFDSSGVPLWQTQVVVYYDAAVQGVRVQEQAFRPPTTDVSQVPTPPAPPAPAFVPGPQDRIVARSIRALQFRLTDGTAPLLVAVDADVNGFASHLESTANPVLDTFDLPPPPP